MAERVIAAGIAIVAFAAFMMLGLDVTRYGEPTELVLWEHTLLNHSTLVAWWITWSCYIYVLVPVALVLLVVAWLVPAWRGRIIFSIVLLLLCWRGADFFQHIFARPRRLDWVVKHETSFSYPSSHAAIATGFYALWGVMLASAANVPGWVAVTGGIGLPVLALAIAWSRLALGAHYITDLVGGALLAVALVAAALALVPIKIFGPKERVE